MDYLSALCGQWESLLGMLPRGFDLEATLRQSGGFVRRRGIRSAEALLRLALVYSLCGLSLRATAAWAQAQGVAKVSDVALLKRLRNAAPWMSQLLAAKLAERVEGLGSQPLGYRLRLVDATTATIPGSQGTDYRIHLGFDLSTFQVDRIEVTGAKGGESYARLAIKAGDLIVADRGYCHRRGLWEVHQAGADFLVRINWQNLPLQDSQQQRLDLLHLLKRIPRKRAVEFEVSTVADKAQGYGSMPARLIVARRPKEVADAERERIKKEASRKGRKADPRTLKAAAFFYVLTSVSQQVLSAEKVLEVYRLRWQIEMAFKRMKGLLHLGEVPVKDPQLAHGYLCAKLLATLMLEDLTRDFLAFSPSASAGADPSGMPLENPADLVGRDGFRLERSAELSGSSPEGSRADTPLF